MLANTYHRAADHEIGYEETQHTLSAIRCVPDTSLEIENFAVSDPTPAPGDIVDLTWDLINNGLLPGTDYRLEATCSVDGGPEESILLWDFDDPYLSVYPGGRQALNSLWLVPEYSESIHVTLTVTEKNPTTGRTDYETTNTAALEVSRAGGLPEGQHLPDQPLRRFRSEGLVP